MVLGLGNPGAEYAHSRHNVGADVVELLAERHGGRLKASTKERSLVAEVRIGTARVVLAFPQTFYNEAGNAARLLLERHGIDDLHRFVVVHDEMDLPPGKLKVKIGGGLAGDGRGHDDGQREAGGEAEEAAGCGGEAGQEHGVHHPVGQGRGPRGHAPSRRTNGRVQESNRHPRPGVAGQQRGDDRGRHADPAAGEAGGEQRAAASHAGGDRAGRSAGQLRRLAARLPLEVAQHERGAVTLREPSQLLVEEWEHVVPRAGSWGRRVGLCQVRFARAPPACGCAGLARGAAGDAVEPVAEQVRAVDRRGPADEHEERGLEGVLGVGAGDAAAHAPHHRRVPAHEGVERYGVGPGAVGGEQLLVGRRGVARHAAPEPADDLVGHAMSRVRAAPAATRVLPEVGGLMRRFSRAG